MARKEGRWETYYPYMLSVEEQLFNGAKNPTEPIPDKRFSKSKCSLCDCPRPLGDDNYCPHCGARMANSIAEIAKKVKQNH